MPHWDDERLCALGHGLDGGAELADEFSVPGAEKHYPPDLEIEPVHLNLELDIDLEHQTARGTVTHALRARRSGPVELRLHGVALEEAAVRDPDGTAVTWQYDGREIHVVWPTPFARDEERRIEVGYRLVKPAAGLYFSKPSEPYPDQPWFAATDSETEKARHWLPCIDLPSARPRLDLHLRADARFTILANGRLVDERDNGDGTKTAHWRLDYPCPSYLTCFAIGDFVRADDGDFEGRPIAYFATPGFSGDDLRRSFGRTREMLTWMTRKLGVPFPFPKYFQFALPDFGGAMENISLVSWTDGAVMDETLAQERTRAVDETNVHEMGHSYFGDAVVIRDFAHAWLKESWATYIEQCWFEDNRGEDERQYQYYNDAQAYFREADQRYRRPIVTRTFKSSWEMYDRHLYPGGACRLHTLRNEIGDETFWEGVQDYLQTYSGQVVETDDFRRVIEAHSGRSLGQFFDQWFFTPGYPALKATFKYDSKRSEGTFEIEQTQVDEQANVPAFVLSTDLGWVIDGDLQTLTVHLEDRKHTFVVPMEKDPEQVRIDPFGKVLHKLDFNPGEERLRRQLTAAPDVIGRILAACQLAKEGSIGSLRALEAAYEREGFWGVRVALAEALSEAGTETAIVILASLLASETDPMVLESLIRAAAKFRDARIQNAIEHRLDAGIGYYRARQAALEALGAQREEAPYDRLAAAAREDGLGGIVQSGAFRALAASRRPEAVSRLLEHVAPGATSNRARPAAVSALADLARLQDRGTQERVAVHLIDLLRDGNPRVRGAAVGGLQTLRAREAIGALSAYRAPLALQEQVRIDRAIEMIRRGDEPKIGELEKQLTEVREELRKLQGSIEKLEARSGSEGDTPPAEVASPEA